MTKNIYQEAYLKTIKNSRWEELQRDFSPEQYTPQKVIYLLNVAIVDEQLAELNYLASYNLSKTQGKNDFDPEFKQHEDEQRDHKHDLIERLRELGSPVPTINITDWQSFNSQGDKWIQEKSNYSKDILLHRIQQEQDAIKFYGLCVAFTRGQEDTTTYTLFKKIKEDEEKHLKDLSDLAIEHGVIAAMVNPCNGTNLNVIPKLNNKNKNILLDQEIE